MYTITIIRLTFDTLSFQNTEVNSFMLYSEVINELSSMGCSPGDIQDFEHMPPRTNRTFESYISNGVKKGLRFAYVFKIN